MCVPYLHEKNKKKQDVKKNQCATKLEKQQISKKEWTKCEEEPICNELGRLQNKY